MSNLVELTKAVEQVEAGIIDVEQAAMELQRPKGQYLKDIQVQLTIDPLPIGFPSLEGDKILRANTPDLVILGGRPGHGKSALAGQIALNLSKTAPVLYFSLEMSAKQVKKRIIALETDRNIRLLENLPSHVLKNTETQLGKYQLILNDTNGIHINELVANAIAWNKISPLSLIVVDYLQIVGCDTKRSKAEEVFYVTEQLKYLAAKLSVPVLALAQLTRAIDGRMMSGEGSAPVSSDFADSSGIEKWADVAMVVHRQYLYDRTRADEADIFVIKNRDGESKEYMFGFNGGLVKFVDGGL